MTTNTNLLPLDQLRFLYAAFIDPKNLTLEEANELDTLIFRCTADLPFGTEAEARMKELEAKAKGEITVLTGDYAIAAGDNIVIGNLAAGNLTGCITVQEPTGCFITAIDPKTWKQDFTFASAGKPVLTITADGELIFDNVTEAAEALMAEWNRLRGAA